MLRLASYFIACASLLALGCQGQKGDPGPRGSKGDMGPVGVGAFVAGSRLEARFDSGSDGSRTFVGWYDHDLLVDCQFARSADGTRRCMPFNEDPYNAPTVVYVDAECMTPPIMTFAKLCDPADGEVPSYIRYEGASECGGWHVRPVEDMMVEPPDTLYAWNGTGQCVVATATVGPKFALGAEMPPDAFVHGGEGVQK